MKNSRIEKAQIITKRAKDLYETMARVNYNVYILDLNAQHGVSTTFNVGDLVLYYEEEEMVSILIQEERIWIQSTTTPKSIGKV